MSTRTPSLYGSRHIELDRRFSQLRPEIDREKAALESYAVDVSGQDPGMGWDELLRQPRVVVLGEPGSGKTWELRRRAKVLRESGQCALFVHLDRLINNTLGSCLGREDATIFKKWRRDRGKAVFFLDSVDESKFGREKDFEHALHSFRNDVHDGLSQATIVISSRISDWRPVDDAILVKNYLRPPHTKSNTNDEDPELCVAKLLPLEEARVRLIAESRLADGSGAFMDVLDQSFAMPYARRPQDVLDLISHWREKGELGSLRDLIEFDLQHKLSESNAREKNDPLNPKEAREGAMALGAAVSLCRRFEFRVADNDSISVSDALDPAACLPDDWAPKKQQAVLARAVFDSESYGRIRFHHRRSAEYLCAEWFRERMKEGCDYSTLRDQLFDSRTGVRILRPSLAPVAAWLACGDEEWNRFVRQWILNSDPTVFLRYGDPECISLDYRKEILKKIVDRYKDKGRISFEYEQENLARLADPGLGPLIRELIKSKGTSNDLRAELVQIIRHGQLSDSINVAVEIIADPNENDTLKHYAAAAVRDAGNTDAKRDLADVVSGWPEIPSGLCGIVCQSIYPDAVGAETLVDLLRKVPEISRNSGDLPWILSYHLKDKPIEDASILVDGLVDLAQQPPHIHFGDQQSPISEKFAWAGGIALEISAVLMSRSNLSDQERASIAAALALLLPWRHVMGDQRYSTASLSERFAAHLEIRRDYAWMRVDDIRRADPDAMPDIWDVFGFGRGVDPTLDDLRWICTAVEDRPNEKERRLALSWAVAVWTRAGRPRRWRRSIRASGSGLSGADLDTTHLQAWLVFHSQRLWYQRFGNTIESRSWWTRKFRTVRDGLKHIREQISLLRNLGSLSSGENTRWLFRLSSGTSAKIGFSMEWTATADTWRSLRTQRGRIVANAVKKGCKTAWRRYQPPLPHESLEKDLRIVVGLVGIAATIEDRELDLDSISLEDACLATRYAVHGMNGFPFWFFDLAQAQQSPVTGVLSDCLHGEWTRPEKEESVHEVLAAIRWHGNPQLQFIADTLLGMLTKCDPLHPAVLEDALAILLQLSNPPRAALTKLAADRAPRYNETDRHWSLWFLIWMQTDSAAALDHMVGPLNRTTEPGALMERICGALSGQHTLAPLLLNDPDYLSPACLQRLIPLAFRYIRPEDDLERQSGVAYSPSARDDAESFRDWLLSQLAASDLPEAAGVLQDLSDEPELDDLRDRILHLAGERRTRLADLPPWRPEDIREFTYNHETDPRTHHDLYRIAGKRLSDIELSVKAAVHSARNDLQQNSPEADLQEWLARQLDHKSKKRYSVVREPEIDPKKKPDLQVHYLSIPAVPIEVKWADEKHWSGPKLFECLRNQLIGDYLHPHDTRCGFYVLGHKGTKKRWRHLDDDRWLGFGELIEALQKHADSIVDGRADVSEVTVVGIDFSPVGNHGDDQ